jgi:hypothetical protein
MGKMKAGRPDGRLLRKVRPGVIKCPGETTEKGGH